MSFRELRNFTEIMRSLGYPRLISSENFRQPNFPLVADCLDWLVKRYDTTYHHELPSNETERVAFLKEVAKIMLTKARVRLNTKKLYAADGYAVKELLKVASLLHAAIRTATGPADDGDADAVAITMESALKGIDLKAARALASEITTTGAALASALAAEPALRAARAAALGRNSDMDDIERQVEAAIGAVGDAVGSTEEMLAHLEKDKAALESKLDKRRAELDRGEKRLATLQAVRPAYMDELDRQQAALQGLYTAYLERVRNLQYLEAELEDNERTERERMAAHEAGLKRMQARLRAEEMRLLRGEVGVAEADLDSFLEEDDEPGGDEPSRGRGAPAKSRLVAAVAAVGKGGGYGGGGFGGGGAVGNLMGGDDDSEDMSAGDDDDDEGGQVERRDLGDADNDF